MASNIKIDDHSDEYRKELDDAIEQALLAIGAHIEGEAKEEIANSPKRIDTGLLRNSITFALDGEAPNVSNYSGSNTSRYGGKDIPSGSYSGTAEKEAGNKRSVAVGTNVEYALYVHEGTVNMAPNRFLKNAVERNKDQIEQYIKNAMS